MLSTVSAADTSVEAVFEAGVVPVCDPDVAVADEATAEEAQTVAEPEITVKLHRVVEIDRSLNQQALSAN